MGGKDSSRREPDDSGTGVLRPRRIEIVDEDGTPRLVIGRLGEADGAVYGLEVMAGDPRVRTCITAEDRSAGLTILGGHETLIECRVSGDPAEVPVAIELGVGGCAVATLRVAHDGALTLALAPASIDRGGIASGR